MLIPTLRILAENKDNEYPQNIFEIGTVFSKDKENKTESGVEENENLIIALCPGNFTQAKQTLDYIVKALSTNYKMEESEKTGLINGRTGSISINGKEVGYLGEVHPETLKSWSIKMPLSVIEISLEEIFKAI